MATGGGSPPRRNTPPAGGKPSPPPGWRPDYPQTLDALDNFYTKRAGRQIETGKTISRTRDEETKNQWARDRPVYDRMRQERLEAAREAERTYGVQNWPREQMLEYINDLLVYCESLANNAVMDRNHERICRSMVDMYENVRHINRVYFHDTKVGLKGDFGDLVKHLLQVLEAAQRDLFKNIPQLLMDVNNDILDLQNLLDPYEDENYSPPKTVPEKLPPPQGWDDPCPGAITHNPKERLNRPPVGTSPLALHTTPPYTPPTSRGPPPKVPTKPQYASRTPSPASSGAAYTAPDTPPDTPSTPMRPRPARVAPVAPSGETTPTRQTPKPVRKAPPKPYAQPFMKPPPKILGHRPYQFPPYSTPDDSQSQYIPVQREAEDLAVHAHLDDPRQQIQISAPIITHDPLAPRTSSEILTMTRQDTYKQQPSATLASFQSGYRKQKTHGHDVTPTPPWRDSSLQSRAELPGAHPKVPYSPSTGRHVQPLRKQYQRDPHDVSPPELQDLDIDDEY